MDSHTLLHTYKPTHTYIHTYISTQLLDVCFFSYFFLFAISVRVCIGEFGILRSPLIYVTAATRVDSKGLGYERKKTKAVHIHVHTRSACRNSHPRAYTCNYLCMYVCMFVPLVCLCLMLRNPFLIVPAYLLYTHTCIHSYIHTFIRIKIRTLCTFIDGYICMCAGKCTYTYNV